MRDGGVHLRQVGDEPADRQAGQACQSGGCPSCPQAAQQVGGGAVTKAVVTLAIPSLHLAHHGDDDRPTGILRVSPKQASRECEHAPQGLEATC